MKITVDFSYTILSLETRLEKCLDSGIDLQFDCFQFLSEEGSLEPVLVQPC